MNRQMFDATAATFAQNIDASLASGTYVRGELFVNALKRHVPRGARVLDFGCGPGRIALLAARVGYEVEGRDTSVGMLTELEKLRATARISVGLCEPDGSDLKSDYYDAIICSSVIEYVVDADLLLANFARAVHRGGILILSYSNRRSLWRAYVRRFQSNRPHHAFQCNIWNYSEACRRLDVCGFEAIEGPKFFDASPFDKRLILRYLSALPVIGTLGFVVVRRNQN